MREILFKAKRISDGQWVEGGYSYCENDDTHYITVMGKDHISHIGFHQQIDPKTICQSTGIYDNNRTMIFENDIVCHKYNTYEDDESEDFLTVRKEKKKNYVIKFDSTPSFMGYRYHNGRNIFPFKKGTVWNGNDEVVGNIHDNPELLGGSK